MTTGSEQNGAVSMGSISRLQFPGPRMEGVTVRICVKVGAVMVYGSYTTPSPSAALNDFSEVLGTEKTCLTLHATTSSGSNENSCSLCNSRNEWQAGEMTGEMLMMYATIEGISETESRFSVNSSVGNAFGN